MIYRASVLPALYVSAYLAGRGIGTLLALLNARRVGLIPAALRGAH